MFQFPINPVVGQIFTPLAGVSYKWNGTAWVPFSTTFVGGMTFTGPVLHADGTLAAPGISWLNEPSAGFYRAGAGSFGYAIGGTTILSLSAAGATITGSLGVSNGLTISGSNLSVTAGSAFANAFLATAAAAGLAYPTAINCAHYNQGLVACGDVSNWPSFFNIWPRHGNGTFTTNPAYRWAHASNGLGNTVFSCLNGTHGSQAQMELAFSAPAFGGAGLGAGMWPRFNSANLGGLLEWEYSGTNTTTWRCSIARTGTINNSGDIAITSNANGQPTVSITGGQTTLALAAIANSPLVVNGVTGGMAGIALKSTTDPYAIMIYQGGGFYWGTTAATGGIGGWSMSLTAAGAVVATSFTPSDASLKSDVRPIVHALESVLRLKGVRFRHNHDKTEGIGLVAQETQAVFPEVVLSVKPPDSDAGILALNYGALIAPIIEAIRELNARLTMLEPP